MTDEQINYNSATLQSEAVARELAESKLEVALARIQQLESDNDELRQRLFEMTEAKKSLTPMTRL